jgi:hypothetical protein
MLARNRFAFASSPPFLANHDAVDQVGQVEREVARRRLRPSRGCRLLTVCYSGRSAVMGSRREVRSAGTHAATIVTTNSSNAARQPLIISAARSRVTMEVVMSAPISRELRRYVAWAAKEARLAEDEAMALTLDRAITDLLEARRALAGARAGLPRRKRQDPHAAAGSAGGETGGEST